MIREGKVDGNLKSLEGMIYLELCHLSGIVNMRKQLRIENVFIQSSAVSFVDPKRRQLKVQLRL